MAKKQKIQLSDGIHTTKGDKIFFFINYVFMILLAVITLYPMLYVAFCSFSGPNEFALVRGLLLRPAGFSLEGYKSVLSEANLWVAYGNTLYYTAVGTVFNIVATTLAAYPLSRRSFVARRPLNFLIAFTMYFSGGLIPSYLLITGLGLYNSRWVMILPVLVSTSNMMICRSAFSSIPEEVIESAYIDGANDMQLYWHIAIRLIVPTLAVLTLYYAVGHWNSYFNAMLYLSKPRLQPLQLLLRRVLLQASSELNNAEESAESAVAVSLQVRYVTIVVSTLPILCFYPFIQKYFIKGVMLGAVKG